MWLLHLPVPCCRTGWKRGRPFDTTRNAFLDPPLAESCPALPPFCRLAHVRLLQQYAGKPTAYIRSPCWVLAFLVYVAGQLLNFVSLSFASQSLLATLGTFSLVTNIIYAR